MTKKSAVVQRHYVWGGAAIVALLGATWVASLAVARQEFGIEVQTAGRGVKVLITVAAPPAVKQPSRTTLPEGQACPHSDK